MAEVGGESRGERGAEMMGDLGERAPEPGPEAEGTSGVKCSCGLLDVDALRESAPDAVPEPGVLVLALALALGVLSPLGSAFTSGSIPGLSTTASGFWSDKLGSGLVLGVERSFGRSMFRGDLYEGDTWRLLLRLRRPEPPMPLAGTMYARPVTRNWVQLGRSHMISVRESAASCDTLGIRKSVVLRRRPLGETGCQLGIEWGRQARR